MDPLAMYREAAKQQMLVNLNELQMPLLAKTLVKLLQSPLAQDIDLKNTDSMGTFFGYTMLICKEAMDQLQQDVKTATVDVPINFAPLAPTLARLRTHTSPILSQVLPDLPSDAERTRYIAVAHKIYEIFAEELGIKGAYLSQVGTLSRSGKTPA